VIAASTLPIARLHLTVRANAPLHLPRYAGSMLRGAFGHALRELALLPHESGQPCALHERCPYCQIFAPPPLASGHSLQKFSQMPPPYVIEPPGADQPRKLNQDDNFRFSLVLIGRAWQHLPAVMQAFERAMQRGLGQHKAPCTLISAQQEASSTPFWQSGQTCPSLQAAALPPAPSLGEQVTLHFRTPLRQQYRNKPARVHELDARTLLTGLARRHQLLHDVYCGTQTPLWDFPTLTQQAETISLDADQLHWVDWERYSNRQRQAMTLGGLIGPVQLRGNLAPFRDLLHLGQWLHVGKETVFGLGGYRLETCAA
jgi:hypothetical protein